MKKILFPRSTSQKGNNADITDWKKKQQQIELGVADPNSSELEACRSLIDSSKK